VLGIDRWIAIAAFTDDEWIALTRVLNRPELASDTRFTTLERRLANQDPLEELIGQLTQKRDGIELMRALQAAGVPAGICATTQDRVEWDPQLRHLQWLMELNQSEIGSWPAKTPPTRYGETPAYQGGIADRHGPNYGEDNEYVYGELLGLTPEEIRKLAQDGVT
jgi:crotonobetainyl-CoA:carnitine CoA-transferase CaiB-like acyl-CoA transferase